jgi:hypothetical protein
MEKSNVSRETSQGYDEKKRILSDFVQNYQPDISLSASGLLKFHSFGVLVEVDLCGCIILSVANVLYIRWLKDKNFMLLTIEA